MRGEGVLLEGAPKAGGGGGLQHDASVVALHHCLSFDTLHSQNLVTVQT